MKDREMEHLEELFGKERLDELYAKWDLSSLLEAAGFSDKDSE